MNAAELPAEILGEIFLHCVHGRWGVHQDKVRIRSLRCITTYADSQTNPIDLIHVCRLWRTAAISYPSLWATIHVYRPRSEGDVKMLKFWLEHSAGSDGSYPLNLTIKQDTSIRPTEPPRFTHRVISLAISQHQRWRHISLELCGIDAYSFRSLYTAAPKLSVLRSVTLSLRVWSTDQIRPLLTILCSSPELQSVTLGTGFGYPPTTVLMFLSIVPWSRQTTLGFKILNQKDFFFILTSSTDTLQHISVSELHSPYLNSGLTNVTHVTMRCLRSMHIGEFIGTNPFAGYPTPSFDYLTLPSLHKLRLPNGFGRPKEIGIQKRGWDTLLRLLDRSDCKLQSFEFGAPSSPSAEGLLTQNLKSSPLFGRLTYLRVTSAIDRHPDSLQLLGALREVHGSGNTKTPAMLPLLETLILDSVYDGPANVTSVNRDVYRGVRRMVSARVAAYGSCDMSKLRRVSAQLVGEAFEFEVDLTCL